MPAETEKLSTISVVELKVQLLNIANGDLVKAQSYLDWINKP